MINPAETVEPEPIYHFVKGKGWVLGPETPPTYDDLVSQGIYLDHLCSSCGYRFGVHSMRGMEGYIYCNFGDGFFRV